MRFFCGGPEMSVISRSISDLLREKGKCEKCPKMSFVSVCVNARIESNDPLDVEVEKCIVRCVNRILLTRQKGIIREGNCTSEFNAEPIKVLLNCTSLQVSKL